MAEFRMMTAEDGRQVQAMLDGESADYLTHLLAFAEPGTLARQRGEARQDAFMTILSGQRVAGFYCLRGLDAGYERPSFGVYVASAFKGGGLGRQALDHALDLCRQRRIARLMLKVAEQNQAAAHLYAAAGFRATGTCPRTGHTIMEKELS